MITVTIRSSRSIESREVSLPGSATGLDILRTIGIHSDNVVLLREGRPIADDEDVADGDEIEMVIVASGG